MPKTEPHAWEALVGLALIAQSSGDMTTAVGYFFPAAKAEPNDLADSLFAVADEHAGHDVEARAAYAEAQRVLRRQQTPRRLLTRRNDTFVSRETEFAQVRGFPPFYPWKGRSQAPLPFSAPPEKR